MHLPFQHGLNLIPYEHPGTSHGFIKAQIPTVSVLETDWPKYKHSSLEKKKNKEKKIKEEDWPKFHLGKEKEGEKKKSRMIGPISDLVSLATFK